MSWAEEITKQVSSLRALSDKSFGDLFVRIVPQDGYTLYEFSLGGSQYSFLQTAGALAFLEGLSAGWMARGLE
jgi:hypothetical protein